MRRTTIILQLGLAFSVAILCGLGAGYRLAKGDRETCDLLLCLALVIAGAGVGVTAGWLHAREKHHYEELADRAHRIAYLTLQRDALRGKVRS
jgi:hypothetical protein